MPEPFPTAPMSADLSVRIGTLRAYYAREHMAIPMCSVHKDRAAWMGLEGEALLKAADDAVLQHGLSLYGYEGDKLSDLPKDYVQWRDYYAKGEIAGRRYGVDIRTIKPYPAGFAAWAKDYRRLIEERRKAQERAIARKEKAA